MLWNPSICHSKKQRMVCLLNEIQNCFSIMISNSEIMYRMLIFFNVIYSLLDMAWHYEKKRVCKRQSKHSEGEHSNISRILFWMNVWQKQRMHKCSTNAIPFILFSATCEVIFDMGINASQSDETAMCDVFDRIFAKYLIRICIPGNDIYVYV